MSNGHQKMLVGDWLIEVELVEVKGYVSHRQYSRCLDLLQGGCTSLLGGRAQIRTPQTPPQDDQVAAGGGRPPP